MGEVAMRVVVIIAAAFMASACATSAAPNFFNGQYYLAGDSNCKTMNSYTPTTIRCMDSKGNFTGYRSAMTAMDLQYYYSQQAYQAQQIAQTQAQINANNAQMMQNTQRSLQGVSSYTPPSVSSPALGGGVTYTQVGSSLLGSNGVTYSWVGNSIMGSDGTTCQIVSQHIICR